jgi:hypothetical protein
LVILIYIFIAETKCSGLLQCPTYDLTNQKKILQHKTKETSSEKHVNKSSAPQSSIGPPSISCKNLHDHHLYRSTYHKDLLVIFILLHQSLETEPILSTKKTCIIDGICLKLKTTSLQQSQIDQNVAAILTRSFFLCVVPWLAVGLETSRAEARWNSEPSQARLGHLASSVMRLGSARYRLASLYTQVLNNSNYSH